MNWIGFGGLLCALSCAPAFAQGISPQSFTSPLPAAAPQLSYSASPKDRATSTAAQLEASLPDPLHLEMRTIGQAKAFARWQVDKPARSLALSESGGVVYVGFEDGSVEAREAGTLRLLWLEWLFDTPVEFLRRAGSELLAVDADGSALILAAATGARLPGSPDNLESAPQSPVIDARLGYRFVTLILGDGTRMDFGRSSQRWRSTPPRVLAVPQTYRTVTVRDARGRTRTQRVVDGPQQTRAQVAPAPSPIVATASYQSAPDLNGSTTTNYSASYAPAPAPVVTSGGFPWPAPPPSDRYDITGARLASAGATSFGDVEAIIASALRGGQYLAPAYYEIDGGFVAVTALETIYPDGRPFDAPARWGENPAGLGGFSLGDLIRAFFEAPKGYYRVIAFALNETIRFDPNSAPVTPEAAEGWLGGTVASLGEALRVQPLDPNRHELSVLIYEFEKPNKVDPAVLVRGRLSAATHLAQAALLEALP